MRSFRFQNIVHWVEAGQGHRIITVLSIAAFTLIFSLFIGFKRGSGPATEDIIEQALIGKNLAAGQGFHSSVIYPQSLAVLTQREKYEFDPKNPPPDVYHAPFYPAVIAGFLKLLPESAETLIWEDPLSKAIKEFPAFRADNFLLGINVFFFILASVLTYWLALRLFNSRTAMVAYFAMILSVGLWDAVLSLSGVSVLMCLVLVLFLLWSFLEKGRFDGGHESGGRWWPFVSAGIGFVIGLIFLTEYTSALVGFVFIGYCIVQFSGSRLIGVLSLSILVFLITVAPWCWRNIELTGHPVGLASQNFALKSGDPTAEPIDFKTSLETKGPNFSIRKVTGKGLAGIELNMKERIWAGGAYGFCAFFLIGCLYRFRRIFPNNLRWYAVISVVLLYFVQPFFNDGESIRLPTTYMTPLVIVFGAGFFLILLDSTKKRFEWEKTAIVWAVLFIHAIPLGHNLAEPKRIPFQYPPYYPSVMTLTRTGLMDIARPRGYGIMADVPAGLAWYSQQIVWAQPKTYADFVEVLVVQDIAALFLSPDVLDRPYFSELLKADIDSGLKYRSERYWGAVYGGLQERKVPEFFPLQRIIQLTENMYVLINPYAVSQ